MRRCTQLPKIGNVLNRVPPRIGFVLALAVVASLGSSSWASAAPDPSESVRFEIFLTASYDPNVTREFGQWDGYLEPEPGDPPGRDFWRSPKVMIYMLTPDGYQRDVIDRFYLNTPDTPEVNRARSGVIITDGTIPTVLGLDRSGQTHFYVEVPSGQERWLVARSAPLLGSSPYCDGNGIQFIGTTDPLVLNASSPPEHPMEFTAVYGIQECLDRRLPAAGPGTLALAIMVTMFCVCRLGRRRRSE